MLTALSRQEKRKLSPRQLIIAVSAVVMLVVVIVGVIRCSPPGSDDGVAGTDLHASPTKLRWETVSTSGKVKVPVAAEGPARVGTHGEATGFQFSPVGAGLAAVNGPLRVAFAPDDHFAEAVSAAFAPGDARDELLVNRAAVSTTGAVDEQLVPTVRGWMVTEFSQATADGSSPRASVTVYTSYPDASTVASTYRLVWVDTVSPTGVGGATSEFSRGDWKIQLPGEIHAVDDTPTDMVKVEAK